MGKYHRHALCAYINGLSNGKDTVTATSGRSNFATSSVAAFDGGLGHCAAHRYALNEVGALCRVQNTLTFAICDSDLIMFLHVEKIKRKEYLAK